MIRMSMRDPNKFTLANGCHLFLGDLVGQRPTPEVGASLDPRIGHQHWSAVVADESRITNRLEAGVHIASTSIEPRGPGTPDSAWSARCAERSMLVRS